MRRNRETLGVHHKPSSAGEGGGVLLAFHCLDDFFASARVAFRKLRLAASSRSALTIFVNCSLRLRRVRLFGSDSIRRSIPMSSRSNHMARNLSNAAFCSSKIGPSIHTTETDAFFSADKDRRGQHAGALATYRPASESARVTILYRLRHGVMQMRELPALKIGPGASVTFPARRTS
jgi:hypothetical protein